MELRAIARGKVQGVYFRRTVKEIAGSFNLTGYAKNLTDGSVEIKAQGSLEILKEFIQKVQLEPGKAKIDSIDISYSEVQSRLHEFETL